MVVIGLASAVIDNVPLVAASMGMYSLAEYPTDAKLWSFLTYCAGTGGSILIIGSAAGVAVMGLEKLDFLWYLRRISWLALLGYAAGALAYLGMGAVWLLGASFCLYPLDVVQRIFTKRVFHFFCRSYTAFTLNETPNARTTPPPPDSFPAPARP